MFGHYYQARNNDVYYFMFLCLCLLIVLSLLWNIYFIKMIVHYTRLYHECLEEAELDFAGNSELALHYKVEIVKYLFLLAINVTEFMALIAYQISIISYSVAASFDIFGNCTEGDIHNSEFNIIILNPIAAAFSSIVYVGIQFSLSLVICLMRYLDVMYHDINGKPMLSMRYVILVSGCIGVILIVTGFIPQLFLVQVVFVPIINLGYLCLWARQTRIFYKTLRWRSVEFKVRGMSSQIVRRSVKNCHYFAITMCAGGIGFLCIFVYEFLEKYYFLVAIGVRYGPCIFQRLYGTAYYEPLLTTKQQIDALNFSNEIVSGIATSLVAVTIITVGSPYLLATTAFFGGNLWKKLKYRYGKVRTRFTPSLT